MRTKVVKWGNSLGLRIPKSFAEEVQVSEGSVVDLSIEDGHLIVRAAPQTTVNLLDLLAGITDENLHEEINTGDAVGGENW
jgi:antitoxin MazE